MSRMQREKGARAEREVARIVREAGWPNAERTSRGVAQAGTGDIRNGPAGYHVEVKRDERLSMQAAIRQAVDDAPVGVVPVVARRWNGNTTWYATLPLVDLLYIIRFAQGTHGMSEWDRPWLGGL